MKHFISEHYPFIINLSVRFPSSTPLVTLFSHPQSPQFFWFSASSSDLFLFFSNFPWRKETRKTEKWPVVRGILHTLGTRIQWKGRNWFCCEDSRKFERVRQLRPLKQRRERSREKLRNFRTFWKKWVNFHFLNFFSIIILILKNVK